MRPHRRVLTYANVAATLALFLAVSGGVVYAAGGLGKNAVKTKNIAPKAVKTKSIAANAVTGAKIKKETITPGKIKSIPDPQQPCHRHPRRSAGRRRPIDVGSRPDHRHRRGGQPGDSGAADRDGSIHPGDRQIV